MQDGAVTLGAGLITGVDQTGERITHAGEFVDAQLQVGDPGAGHRPGLLAGVGSALGEVQQVLDVVEGESELFSALDETHHPHRVRGIGAIPRGGPLGFGEQAAAFVVPQGLGVDLGLRGDLACPHPTSMNPVPRY